jgi:hypothetical protein
MHGYRLVLALSVLLHGGFGLFAQEVHVLPLPPDGQAGEQETSGNVTLAQPPTLEPVPGLTTPVFEPQARLPWDNRYRSLATRRGYPRTLPWCVDGGRPTHWHSDGPLHQFWKYKLKPTLQEIHWGYCDYFEEPPFGCQVHRAVTAQVAKGYMDQFMLFQYDFRPADGPRGGELNPRGHAQLSKIVHRFQNMPAPLLIEKSYDDAELDSARRAYVLSVLQHHGVPIPEEAVLVVPRHHTLSAQDALDISNLLRGLMSSGGGAGRASAGASVGPASSAAGTSYPMR